jgi:hypothetical protein
VFLAEFCVMDGPWVHAAGRWRWQNTWVETVPVHPSVRATYSLPVERVDSVRWT